VISSLDTYSVNLEQTRLKQQWNWII
jgi:hypothetical protein